MRTENSQYSTGLARIDKGIDAQVRKLADMTRRPVARVMNELLAYALAHVEVTPVKLYDIAFRGMKSNGINTLEETGKS